MANETSGDRCCLGSDCSTRLGDGYPYRRVLVVPSSYPVMPFVMVLDMVLRVVCDGSDLERICVWILRWEM